MNGIQSFTQAQIPRLERVCKTLKIVFVEAFAVLRHAIPNAARWVWRSHIAKVIKVERIETGFFNTHGKVDKAASSVLFCHGDYGHPFTMLHLADVAEKKKVNVFSLYLPRAHKNALFHRHADILGKTIEKINTIAPHAILGVGHSKGAILLAHRHFVDIDPHLDHVLSIAGRLRIPTTVPPDPRDLVDTDLKEILAPISQGIEDHLERKLTQIVPKDDWNASQGAMRVREATAHAVPGMHYSGLYAKETKNVFESFITGFTA